MAGGAIKGITVEIGGDTTKLGKAIGDSEKKSRSLQVELKQIENLLKFDPSNVELLSQKQKVLTQNIQETNKKLETLKEAEKQVIVQFERGEVAEEQVRALQREIIKTEGVLGKMKTEVSATETAIKNLANGTGNAQKNTKEYKQSVEDAKNELEEFKGKASEAFDTLKTGVTVLGGAVVATGGYASKLSTDFDQAFNTLIAQTGASTDEIDDLNTAMEGVYANNFGESIEDVAQSMAIVQQNTKLSGKELQNTTEYALLLRDTFDFDVSESTRSATMLMQQFGLSGHEAYNLMAQGAQDGLNKNGDLMDVINEYSVHFKQMGFDAEEMFNILIAGSESGAFSVDKVGDAFKEFGIRVKDESDATKDAFTQLGLDADEMSSAFAKGGDDAVKAYLAVNEALIALDDPLKQNQLGVALYGTMWEDLGATVIKEMYNFGDQFNSTRDTMESINEIKYDDIGSALQGLKRTLDTEVIKPLGDELKPVIEDAIGYVTENAPQIKEFISTVVEKVKEFVCYVVEHGDVILSVITGIGAGLALWNVVSMITGLVSAINAFKLANESATVAQALLNAVMNANPIGILITVIGAVVVAITTFILTNEDAREKFIEIWNKIKDVAGVVINALVTFFTETIPNAIGVVIDWFKSLPEKIRSGIASAVDVVRNIFNNIKTTISNTINTIKSNVSNVFNTIKTNITTIINGIKTTISNVFNSIKTTITNVFNGIKNTISNTMTTIKTTISNAWNTIKSTITSVVNGIKSTISSVWNGIKSTVTTVVNGIKSTISSVWNSIKSTTSTIFNSIKDAMSNALNNAKASVVNTCNNIFTGMKNAFGNVTNTFRSIGTNVIEGIKSGISGAVSGLYESIKSALGGLVDKAKDALGIHSPSRVFASVVGEQIPAGVAQGIDDNTDVADEAVQDMTDDLTDQANNLNGATINRKLATTFSVGSANLTTDNMALLNKLDDIYHKLGRLRMVTDTGALVGEMIDQIDSGLGYRKVLSARGV